MCKDQPRDPVTGHFLKGIGGNPSTRFNKENASEMAKRATAARLRNKHGRDLCREIMNLPVKDSMVAAKLREMGYDDAELTNEVCMIARLVERVQKKGDPLAFRELQHLAGYDEGETVNVTVSGTEDGAPVIVFREPKN